MWHFFVNLQWLVTLFPFLLDVIYGIEPLGDVTCWSFTFHRLIPLPNTSLVNIAEIGFLSKKIKWDSERFWVNATVEENCHWLWTLSVRVNAHDDTSSLLDRTAYFFRFLFKWKRGCINALTICNDAYLDSAQKSFIIMPEGYEAICELQRESSMRPKMERWVSDIGALNSRDTKQIWQIQHHPILLIIHC